MPQMPDFTTQDNAPVSAGAIAGIGGALGAIPILNILSPALTAGMAQAGQEAQYAEMAKNAGMLQGPQYQSAAGINNVYSGDFTPTGYRTPESAQYSLAQDSPEGRAAQLAALQKIGGLTDQSAASSSALGRNQAEIDARQLAQSREDAIRQDAMRRGQLGGAADMISRQQAAQAAANMNLNSGLQNAQQAALMQLAGTQASGALAGQMRGQDLSLNMNNANAINAFNLHNTDARNSVNNANTQLANTAGIRNLDARQTFNNNNTNLAMAKLNRSDKNENSQYQAELDKYNAINEILKGRASLYGGANSAAIAAGKQGASNLQNIAGSAGAGMANL